MLRFPSLPHRQRAHELMDDPSVDPDLLRKSLAYIRAINRFLGYTRATLSHLDRFARAWPRGKTLTILDVATGSADVPAAVLKLADRRRLDVRIVALDLGDRVIREAARLVPDPRVTFVRADATRLPFDNASFDYAMTSMFLHHLDDDQIVSVFRELDRVSRHGLLAADLVRKPLAVFWIRLFSCAANPIVRHDAVVSVRQAFREAEITALASQARLRNLRYFAHFGHRFVLTSDKNA
jgi:hypothetical protein